MRLLAAIIILPSSVAAVLWFAASQFGGTRGVDGADTADDLGRRVYMTRCVSCHQVDGGGLSRYFPPLDGTEWVAEEKGRLIRIVLHGMTGPTTVRGVEYNGAMPAWGPVLSDAEVASVLSYVRSAWSNAAPPIEDADVTAVRALTSSRSEPWTHDELLREENRTVPRPEMSESESEVESEE